MRSLDWRHPCRLLATSRQHPVDALQGRQRSIAKIRPQRLSTFSQELVLEETNKMDEKPFLEINILDIKENQASYKWH